MPAFSEALILSSPLWLIALRAFARFNAARYLLLGTAIFAFLTLALLYWFAHDCGSSGFIGFSQSCDFTPRWLITWMGTPVILSMLALFVVLPGAVLIALVIEVIGRWRARRKATSPDGTKPLDRQ